MNLLNNNKTSFNILNDVKKDGIVLNNKANESFSNSTHKVLSDRVTFAESVSNRANDILQLGFLDTDEYRIEFERQIKMALLENNVILKGALVNAYKMNLNTQTSNKIKEWAVVILKNYNIIQ
jgi:hypothetical protein